MPMPTLTHNHRRRIAELEAELNELAATLDAARTMNRELISEINRPRPNPPASTPRQQK